MSRIHDALKKAQQERATGLVPEAPLPAIGSQETELRSLPEIATVRQLPPPTGDASDPLTVATLEARCARPKWNPEPKIVKLFTSLNHVAGGEELRTLRSRLYQIRDQQPLKKLLISSAVPAEGKTFLTASLAQAIVRQHERRALIIDADLRKSQLHGVFGAPVAPGLTDYLSGEADECSIVQVGPWGNLFLIPGGKPAEHPAELLANGKLQTLLERLSPLFDWVLIDSPPVVPVADSTMVAKFCDGVLLVVRAESTPFDLAQKARDEFRGDHLIGVVLNRTAPSGSYHSYYEHYYGSAARTNSKKGG